MVDGLRPKAIGGWLLIALIGFTAWALTTATALRDPLELTLEWELWAVFARPGTHGWYRTVMALVGLDVLIGTFIVAGAGWLALLVFRHSARFTQQVRTWLFAIVVMRTGAYLFGVYMSNAIGIDIAIPADGLLQSLAAAGLGIPYFRSSRRVRDTFVNA
ncbi:DUF2569 domain-containing protein [Paraburkholderia sp. BCC1884]|uniref:DUF2569 domain-containing protein n=1 Tax=Paraburkholderia sp. BCC1884 TaxID=2562668 RepID=UPI0011832EF1|nr:DUF2569 domain-containing protein [Paraburkholderia sp. BCC1884]